jgi:hypothetical protein
MYIPSLIDCKAAIRGRPSLARTPEGGKRQGKYIGLDDVLGRKELKTLHVEGLALINIGLM